MRSSPEHKILLVEDNFDFALALESLLVKKGYSTRTAHSGSEALSLFFSFQPSIVLLDLGLPDIDGYTVCKAMRNSAQGPEISVVALTGWGEDNHLKLSKSAGFDAHFVKPVDLEKVLHFISQITMPDSHP